MHLKINDFTFEAENKYLSSPISQFNDKHFHYFEINYSNGFPKTSQTGK